MYKILLIAFFSMGFSNELPFSDRDFCKNCSDKKKWDRIHLEYKKSSFKRMFTRYTMERRYGAIYNTPGGLVWPNKRYWMVRFPVEDYLPDLVEYNNRPVNSWYVNKDIVGPLASVLSELRVRGLLHEIKYFSGSYSLRTVGGTNNISTHSYGLSLDFNSLIMPWGKPNKWSYDFVAVWLRNGWCWGGFLQKQDPMHFSWGHECKYQRDH